MNVPNVPGPIRTDRDQLDGRDGRGLLRVGPLEIEAESMRMIEAEVPEPRPYQGDQWLVVRRMLHASADFELLRLVRFHPRAVRAVVGALAGGANVYTDTEMALAGIRARMKRLGCKAVCLTGTQEAREMADRMGLTRSAAAVRLAGALGAGEPGWEKASRSAPAPGPVWLIGNAPTALVAILDGLDAGLPPPSAIIGMPVGFVNAAESKALLMARDDVPWISVEGRKGGSPLAAAAMNALADLALAAPRKS